MVTYCGDLYKILHVSKKATLQEIKTSYKKLAIRYHPDKNKDGAEMFKDISHAYNILSDLEQRQLYDNWLKYGDSSSSSASKSNSSKKPTKPAHQYLATPLTSPINKDVYDFKPREAYQIHTKYTATLRDIFIGSTVTVPYTETLSCPKCLNGVKKVVQTRNCSSCKGYGSYTKAPTKKCTACDGTGREQVTLKCTRCHDIYKTHQRTTNVVVTKGLFPTQTHEIKNSGNLMHDGLRGDITVTFDIDLLSDGFFFLMAPDRLDLACKCTIPLEDALLGFQDRYMCTHMDGKPVTYSQPPGSVLKPGSCIAIPNKGMPDPNNSNNCGNLMIFLEITFPDVVHPSENRLGAIKRFFSGERSPSPPPPPAPAPAPARTSAPQPHSRKPLFSTSQHSERRSFWRIPLRTTDPKHTTTAPATTRTSPATTNTATTTTSQSLFGDFLYIPPKIKRKSAAAINSTNANDDKEAAAKANNGYSHLSLSPEKSSSSNGELPSKKDRKRSRSHISDDDFKSLFLSRPRRSAHSNEDSNKKKPDIEKQKEKSSVDQEKNPYTRHEEVDALLRSPSRRSSLSHSRTISPQPTPPQEDGLKNPGLGQNDIIVIDDDED